MKKCRLLFLMVFLMVPFVFADITITTDQSIYNLGNKIKAYASVLQQQNFEGLFRLTISCDDYKLQYFLTPLSLEANFRTAVNVPELVATSSMLGHCSIIGDLATNDNLVVEQQSSNDFDIKNELIVLPVNSRLTVLPGDTIHISGVVNEAFGNNVFKASTRISMDNNSYTIDAVDGKFNMSLAIPKNIKSGKHTIEITASDPKDNSGISSVELDVIAVPSYIKTELSTYKVEPGAKVEIVSSLYDQADDLINASLDLELKHSDGTKVFTKVVQSNEKISYEFSQYAKPGAYVLLSAYKDLSTQSFLNITTVREVKIKYENETVLIENVGNIEFEDELTFILESELKKYPIIKKINVVPGKILSIDLSKEVPLGIYNVKVPVKEGFEPIAEKLGELAQNAAESRHSPFLTANLSLASDVTIHDNRPIYKRITGSLASVSGTLVGADGILTKNPVIAPLVLVVILLLIILRYGRKPIMRLIKGKKEYEKQ